MATIVNTITQSTPSSSPAEGQEKKNFDSSRIDFLSSSFANIDSGRYTNLHIDSSHINTLTANSISFTGLNVDSGNITTLSTTTLNPATINATTINGDSGNYVNLTATNLTATNLNISNGTTLSFSGIFTNLTADSANITNITSHTLKRTPPAGVTPGKYGQMGANSKLSKAPIITVDSSGFINITDQGAVAGVASTAFDSASFNFSINTTDSGSTPVVKMAHTRKPGIDASAGFYGTSSKIPTVKINQYGHVDSIALVDIAGISSTNWDSANSTFQITQTDGSVVSEVINGWGDNQKIFLGTGQDLQIYHDTTNSVIKDNGDGSLILASDNVAIQNVGQTETMATFQQDAGTALYFDNGQKLVTTTAGVQVTGTMTTTSGITAGSHILPATDGDVDLGSATKKFRDLHLSGSTLKIGTIQFKDSASGLRVEKITGNEVVPIVFRELNVDSATVTGNITAGTFTGDGNALTNFNPAQIRTHITAGTGVSFVGGEIAIGQAVGTGNDVQFKDLILTGDLTVQGNTTTLNTATLDVEDKNITIAKGAASAADADGGGINIEGAGANFTYTSSNDRFNMNKDLQVSMMHGNVTGTVSSLANHDTDALSEGSTNLYFTQGRARQSISGDKGLTYNSGTGIMDVDSSNIIEFTRASLGGDKGLTYNTTTGVMDVDSANVKEMFTGVNNIVYNNSTGQIRTNITSADLSTDSSYLTATSSNQVISSISALTHRSVKFLVQVRVDAGGEKVQTSEINVIHQGGNAFMTEYGRVGNTDDNLATYDADINTNNLRLLVTPANANTEFKVFKTAVKINTT